MDTLPALSTPRAGAAAEPLALTPDGLAALARSALTDAARDAAGRMLYALTRPTPSIAWPAWDVLPEPERETMRRDGAAVIAAALEVTR